MNSGSKEIILTKERISEWMTELQNDISTALEQLDGKGKFHEDDWVRPGGGGGKSRILTNGLVFEKAGVNYSAVYGETPQKVKEKLNISGNIFFATGVSIVIHPINPWVPIIHMNIRYFELSNETRWFGGGIDLTPHYVDKKDAAFFHSQLQKACDKHHQDYYELFKQQADDYFFIPHRKETRGVGGIFFDRLKADQDMSYEKLWEFVQEIGLTFVPTYAALVNKNKDKDFSKEEKNWQELRRGRYVEFNLVYDSGTKFGLETNGRTESILMSLPPLAQWQYDYKPISGSKEEETLKFLKKDINWLTFL